MRLAVRKLIVVCGIFLILAGALGAGCAAKPAEPGHIVFEARDENGADIYRMKDDGSEIMLLVDGPTWDGTPALSPDGKRLAFASDRDGDPEIFVMNLDGSDLIQLTDNDATDLMPRWSPDGTRIAFVSDRTYKVPLAGGSLEIVAGMELYTMNADGSDLQRLSGNENDVSLYPSWSPDGTRIVYMNLTDHGTLRVVDLNNVEAEPAELSLEIDLSAWSPQWSPNGAHIAFMGDDGASKDVYRVDPNGKNLVNLTADWPHLSGDPAWSPDGSKIVFASGGDGTINLYVVDRAGKKITALTEVQGQYVQPHWSK